jgi:TRAP-type C4-dicarboxylate transport system substrate-binding protein
LPAKYRTILDEAKPGAYEALKKAQDESDKKNLEEWKKRGLVALVYPPAELKKFREMGAAPVWKEWVTENTGKGVPAQELLDLVLREADQAKKKLGKS